MYLFGIIGLSDFRRARRKIETQKEVQVRHFHTANISVCDIKHAQVSSFQQHVIYG